MNAYIKTIEYAEKELTENVTKDICSDMNREGYSCIYLNAKCDGANRVKEKVIGWFLEKGYRVTRDSESYEDSPIMVTITLP